MDGLETRAALLPEERVLLASVRDDAGSEEIAELLPRCDMTRLLFLSVSERATSVLWPRIAPLLGGRTAAERQPFERTARVSDFRQLLLEDRLASTVAALSDMRPLPVLLKGAALGVATYRSFAARPMGDLDILVESKQEAAVLRRLAVAGWESEQAGDVERYAHHHHLPLISDAAGAKLSIELHTELFFDGNPFRFGAMELREASVPATVRGQPVLVPSPVHRLLHCVLHFAWSHELSEGAWRTMRDVDAIVRQGGIDWPEFIALAERVRGTTAAYWTLRLSRVFGQVAVPEAVERALRAPGGRALHDRLERHYAMNLFPQTARSPSKWLSHKLWEAGLRPGASGHGSSRPWMWDDRFGAVRASVLGGGPGEGVGERMRQLGGRATRWAEYGWRVLGGERGRTS